MRRQIAGSMWDEIDLNLANIHFKLKASILQTLANRDQLLLRSEMKEGFSRIC